MTEREETQFKEGELWMWENNSAGWVGLRGRNMVSSYFLRVVGGGRGIRRRRQDQQAENSERS